MIFNEKVFLRFIKAHKKSGVVYGKNSENYLFGAGNWRAVIHEDKVTQNIYGDMMKLTGLYPQKDRVFECIDGDLAQYIFTDPKEWEVPKTVDKLSVYDIIINDSLRVMSDSEGKIYLVDDVFIQMLDKESVTDEEYMFTGPYYSPEEDKFIWANDCCTMKVFNRYNDYAAASPAVKVFGKVINDLAPSLKYTYHH